MSARLIAKVVVFRHFYLRNGRAARSNQHVHKYCFALSPERHHGPWHTAVFTGRSSHLSPVTREATTSLITLSLSPSRGGSIVTSLYSCRARERRNAGKRASKAKARRVLRHLLRSSSAVALCCSGGVVSSAAGTGPRSPIEKPRETDDRR